MITFYGYAVKKDGKWLTSKVSKKNFRPIFSTSPKSPVVFMHKNVARSAYGHLGKVVKVKLTMEEEGAYNGK